MKKLIYSVAMSLDGYIAGPNGEADWIVMDSDFDFDFTGESIVNAIEQLCEIEYLESDAEHDDAGLFGDGDAFEDDDDDDSYSLSF